MGQHNTIENGLDFVTSLHLKRERYNFTFSESASVLYRRRFYLDLGFHACTHGWCSLTPASCTAPAIGSGGGSLKALGTTHVNLILQCLLIRLLTGIDLVQNKSVVVCWRLDSQQGI